MAKVVYIEDRMNKKRHLESQDVFESSSDIRAVEEVNSGVRQGVYKISRGLISPKIDTSYHEFSRPRLESARDLLQRWKDENRLNLKIRKDLAQQIEIDDHGIRIGRIYWEFAYIFQDTLEKGEKYLKKFKLKVPTVEEVDSSALLLPGDCIEDKRANLLRLLGFIANESSQCKLWTSTKRNSEESEDINLGTNVLDIVRVFKTKMKNFILSNDGYSSLLYHYGTGIIYYETSQKEIGNICGVRKLKNI